MSKKESTLAVNIARIDLELQPLTNIERVRVLAEHVLEEKGNFSQDNTLGTSEIREFAREHNAELFQEIPDSTFAVYISLAGKNPASRINSAGRARGYYLLSKDALPTEEATESKAAANARVVREEKLYDLIEVWLRSKGYQTDPVFNLKKNGQWGNPDLLGLKILQAFGGHSIEVLTIEAKISNSNWRQFIFEAVSHRRFANRAYFAFLHPEDLSDKAETEAMRYYAELFQVGILMISAPSKIVEMIQSANKPQALTGDDAEILEIMPAPYSVVPPDRQFEFLRNIGLETERDLHRFGAT